jgi:hypothetical protein
VQVLHPPQKFKRPPFWNGWSYGIKKYGVEVTFNGMTSLLNFIKNIPIGSKVIRGTHRQTDRQTGDLISLTFLFKESTLKNGTIVLNYICFHGRQLIYYALFHDVHEMDAYRAGHVCLSA